MHQQLTPIQSTPLSRDFEVLDTIVAGMRLTGHQVKSIASNQFTIKGARAVMTPNGFAVTGMQFHNATQTVVVLMHKREIQWCTGLATRKGLTVMVESVGQSRGKFKVTLAICRGKTKGDKRADLKATDIDLRLRRIVNNRETIE